MVAVFILLIVAVGILAGFGYTVFNFQRAAEIASLTQRNAVRMEAVASAIRSASTPLGVGGPPRAPSGFYEESIGRTVVPRKIVGDDRTPWGAQYGYCPLAEASTTDNTGTSPEIIYGDPNYTVRVRDNRGIFFVTDGGSNAPIIRAVSPDTLPEGLLGLVISPSVNEYQIPSCDQVIYRDGAFIVGLDDNGDGIAEEANVSGSAYGIVASTSSLALMSSDLDPTIYVTPGTTATGTGATAADPMTLLKATQYWNTVRPTKLTINMADGSYPLGTTGMILKYSQADITGKQVTTEREIRFTDSSPETAAGAKLTATVATDLDFGIVGILEGITLDTRVGVKASAGSDVRIENSVISQLRLEGGNVVIGSASDILQDSSRTGSPITVVNGELTIAERGTETFTVTGLATNGGPGIVASGGQINVNANVAFPNSQLAWYLTNSATLNLGQDELISFPGATIPTPETKKVRSAGYLQANPPANPKTAWCPIMQPYVVQASCWHALAPLTSSSLVAAVGNSPQKWTCAWGGYVDTLGALQPPPTSGTNVTIECSTSPP